MLILIKTARGQVTLAKLCQTCQSFSSYMSTSKRSLGRAKRKVQNKYLIYYVTRPKA